MGSGGLRGLQILRSGVQSARGGFDSHAFPPLLVAVLLAGELLLAPVCARAQNPLAPPDSVLARDTSEVVTVPESATPPAPRPEALFDQPRFVMFRSLLIPGWGQLHNGAWLKAALVAGAEGYLVAHLVGDQRDLDRLNAEVDVARAAGDFEAENLAVDRYNTRLDRYVGRQWLLGAVVAYALMDAYVDAHFVHFKMEFENDPARPPGVRVGVEKHF